MIYALVNDNDNTLHDLTQNCIFQLFVSSNLLLHSKDQWHTYGIPTSIA